MYAPMKNRTLVIIFTALALLCAAVILIGGGSRNTQKTAQIKRDGRVIQTIDLNAVSEPYDLKVEGEGGYNIMRIEKGAISVIEADCPDKVCIKQGKITGSSYPIVCLPHKLTVEIISGGRDREKVDAVTGR